MYQGRPGNLANRPSSSHLLPSPPLTFFFPLQPLPNQASHSGTRLRDSAFQEALLTQIFMILARLPTGRCRWLRPSPPQTLKSRPPAGPQPSPEPAPITAAVHTDKAGLFDKAVPAGTRHFPSDGSFCTEPGGSCRMEERGAGSGACSGPAPSPPSPTPSRGSTGGLTCSLEPLNPMLKSPP